MLEFSIVKIRRLDAERDLAGYLAVVHQVDRFPRTADEWRERQRLAGPDAFRRYLVGEVGGRIVAAAAILDNEMAPNAVTVRLIVDVDRRGRGHGRAMATAVEAMIAEHVPAPDAIEVRVRDDDAAARAWAERRGFRLHNHAIRSRLDLRAFDPASHRVAVARAEAAGMRFLTPDDWDRLYDLYAALLRDAPDRLEPPSRDRFHQRRAAHPDAIQLVAVDGAEWVGLAIASIDAQGGASNDFTGVAAEHRGRGVARAMKLIVCEDLAARGVSQLETTNNALNAPMLAVNRSLGYVPVEGLLFLRRALH
jgi:ribosomal protein S18 acetylase RimI-like enzyme